MLPEIEDDGRSFEDWIQTVGAAWALVLSVSYALLRTGRSVLNLWPGRDKWTGECKPAMPDERFYGDQRLDPRRAFRSSESRWSQMRAQRPGDYYELKLDKRRIIDRVRFIEDQHGFPKRYRLLFDLRGDRTWELAGEYDGPVNRDLGKPVALYGLRIEVSEPTLEPLGREGFPPAWSIHDIRLREVRLFRHWWRKVIG